MEPAEPELEQELVQGHNPLLELHLLTLPKNALIKKWYSKRARSSGSIS